MIGPRFSDEMFIAKAFATIELTTRGLLIFSIQERIPTNLETKYNSGVMRCERNERGILEKRFLAMQWSRDHQFPGRSTPNARTNSGSRIIEIVGGQIRITTIFSSAAVANMRDDCTFRQNR